MEILTGASDSSAIVRENLLGLALFIVLALGPWLLLAFLSWRRKGRRLRVLGLGIVPTLVASIVGLYVTVCGYPGPPGTGAKAEIGKRRAAPVVEALAAYRRSLGNYPDSLQALVPQFLPDTTLRELARLLGYPLEYESIAAGSSFQLVFRYGGPGMNECAWTDTSSAWRCGGYF